MSGVSACAGLAGATFELEAEVGAGLADTVVLGETLVMDLIVIVVGWGGLILMVNGDGEGVDDGAADEEPVLAALLLFCGIVCCFSTMLFKEGMAGNPKEKKDCCASSQPLNCISNGVLRIEAAQGAFEAAVHVDVEEAVIWDVGCEGAAVSKNCSCCTVCSIGNVEESEYEKSFEAPTSSRGAHLTVDAAFIASVACHMKFPLSCCV